MANDVTVYIWVPTTRVLYLTHHLNICHCAQRRWDGPKFIKTAQGQRAKVKLQGSKGQSLYMRCVAHVAASLKDVKGESNTYSSCESDPSIHMVHTNTPVVSRSTPYLYTLEKGCREAQHFNSVAILHACICISLNLTCKKNETTKLCTACQSRSRQLVNDGLILNLIMHGEI